MEDETFSLKSRSNYLLLAFFILTIFIIFNLGTRYKHVKIQEHSIKQYHSTASALSDEVATLIEEKKNATLTLALALAQNDQLKQALKKKTTLHDISKSFLRRLREKTDFKNVWIQLIDKHGNSHSRSWTDKHGDGREKIDQELRNMLDRPKVRSTISVGTSDMTFNTMVPIFDNTDLIGFLKVITHFNSIATKIKERGLEPVILVDKKYKEQFEHPFTKRFAGSYYIANNNADDTLVDYIAEQGVKHFISPHDKYIIDRRLSAIVIDHTLFDTDDLPMANILMFKPLKELALESIESIAIIVDLFMLLSIIIIGFVLYLFSNKSSMTRHAGNRTYTTVFVLTFISLATIYYLLLQYNDKTQRERYLNSYNENIDKDYWIIHEKFGTVAETMFHSVIDKPPVIRLVAQAYSEKKELARKELFDSLIEEYEFFQRYELRQLHFHLKDNESFLRFHRPERFGDDLTGIRQTVEWVNTNQSRIDGFEEGRIYNGFRYVFPLSQIKESGESVHIGSVEISFSAYAIANEFIMAHQNKAGFLINTEVMDAKVFKEERSNYEKSIFPGFHHESVIKEHLQHATHYMDTSLLDQRRLKEISERIALGDVFTICSTNQYELFTFLPIRNPVTKKVVAALVLQVDNTFFADQDNNLQIQRYTGLMTILFIFLFVYREYVTKHNFQRLSLKTKKILDSQEAIVIITDGRRIIEINKRFLEFFDYTSLDDFNREFENISDLFIRDDNYFHPGKVPKEENWIAFLETLPKREHIVSMFDTEKKIHSFAVTSKHFEQDYILAFTDITDTITERISLGQRVSFDRMTGAYNRDYFENNINLVIQETRNKSLQLYIILLDIDHFKIVNDTYGHKRGDQVLKQLVTTVKNSVRQDDALIRWGGEEFILLIKIDSMDSIKQMAENIRSRIAHDYFEEVGQVTCSFGISQYKDKEDIENTIERADFSLYQAKRNGRNQVVFNDR